MDTGQVITPTQIFPTVDKAAPEKSVAQKTADGFENFALKLGVSARGAEGCSDNTISDGHFQFNLLTRNRIQLEAAYRGSWVVGRVVDCRAEDMTRAGIDITTTDGADDIQDMKALMSRLQIWTSLCDAIKWGRLYGGCIAVMQIEGQKLDTPLSIDRIGEGQFKGLAVYDRWQLWPSLDKLIEVGPNMGLPKYYDIVLGSNLNDPNQIEGQGKEASGQASGRVRVHHSRCMRFGAIKLPFFQAITEMMWDESTIERLFSNLINYETTTASVANLVTRANLRTVQIDQLRQILSAGGEAEEALIKQFDYMRKFQNNDGITLLDKEDVFASIAYAFSGLDGVLREFKEDLSGACDTPLARLYGQAPGGLNSTGEMEMQMYYDSIHANQEGSLRNGIHDLLQVMWCSLRGKPAPKDLSFEFNPLKQMSALEKSQVATANTQSIVSAHQEGGISTQVMMKELKHQAAETGLFNNITDEDIEDAKNEEPPVPDLTTPSEKPAEKDDEKEKPEDKLKKPTGDSAWKKIKRWMAGDKKPEPIPAPIVKRVRVTDDQRKIQEWLKKNV